MKYYSISGGKMKKPFLILVSLLLVFQASVFAQSAAETDSLKSDKLNKESQNLDAQIKSFSVKIADVIKKYKLKEAGKLGAMPYQTSLIKGDDYILLEKHAYIRDYFTGEIVGVRKRNLKLYISGDSVTKFESEILEKNYAESKSISIKIIDPSPSTDDTSDIVFSHTDSGIVYLKDKKMSDVKNTTAFPVANNLKREFYIPHLTFFYDTIITIAESYVKNSKDADADMAEYLIDSMQY